ncbi:MAG: helix-turn-helix transcriptional regulator [Anaerolineaceae bacterium]|nr:helix-turn-helix transcriptional regulator [Anaerolineaceae bacterium]
MHKDILVFYGNTIRHLRQNKGISQEELGDLCNLHRTYISDIELGKRNVSLENIEKIALALNMTISEIFIEVERRNSI